MYTKESPCMQNISNKFPSNFLPKCFCIINLRSGIRENTRNGYKICFGAG